MFVLRKCKLLQKLLSKDYLDVKKIVLTSYNTATLKDHKDLFDRALKEYIDYIPEFSSSASLSQYFYQRRLIVSFNDGRMVNIELLMNNDSINCGGVTC